MMGFNGSMWLWLGHHHPLNLWISYRSCCAVLSLKGGGGEQSIDFMFWNTSIKSAIHRVSLNVYYSPAFVCSPRQGWDGELKNCLKILNNPTSPSLYLSASRRRIHTLSSIISSGCAAPTARRHQRGPLSSQKNTNKQDQGMRSMN